MGFRVVPRVVYVFIVIIILAFLGGFPAYLAIGQGGSQGDTVTVTAQPAYTLPVGGWGAGGVGGVGCPAGEVSTAGRITSDGLVVRTFVIESFDKRFCLILDEGTVVLTPDGRCPRCIGIHIDEMRTFPPPPEGAHVIGTMCDVVPDGTTFTPPATLKYIYDQSDIHEGVTEESLVMAYYDEAIGKWIKLGCVVDAEANIIMAEASHLTAFAVLSYEVVVPAAFEVSSLSISPTEVDIGETLNITILVANTGGQSGSYKVILKINGVAEVDKEVAINAGASEQVSFSIARDTAGIYSVDVNGLTGSFEVKQPVEPAPVKPTNWWLIGGIITAVVVVGSVIYLFLIRRRD
jgi:hypothetical protein